MKTPIFALFFAGILAPSAVSGDINHQYGYNFLPIRDAGNEPYMFQHPDHGQVPLYGGVSYEFRMANTVTNATQWASFLNDFRSAFGSEDVAGTSYDSLRSNFVTDVNGIITALPGYEQYPIQAPWRGAAIYCNWLHHGQTDDSESLLYGAYNAHTFGNVNGIPADNTTPLDAARYWIPTQDELAKAAYYDPNYSAPGVGGYWVYPDMGNDPLVGDYPENGGETNAFSPPFPGSAVLPVLSYPDVVSAYGISDISGVVREMTSTLDGSGFSVVSTSSQAGIDSAYADVVDRVDIQFSEEVNLNFGKGGFRIAARIPSPSAFGLILVSCTLLTIRKRKGLL